MTARPTQQPPAGARRSARTREPPCDRRDQRRRETQPACQAERAVQAQQGDGEEPAPSDPVTEASVLSAYAVPSGERRPRAPARQSTARADTPRPARARPGPRAPRPSASATSAVCRTERRSSPPRAPTVETIDPATDDTHVAAIVVPPRATASQSAGRVERPASDTPIMIRQPARQSRRQAWRRTHTWTDRSPTRTRGSRQSPTETLRRLSAARTVSPSQRGAGACASRRSVGGARTSSPRPTLSRRGARLFSMPAPPLRVLAFQGWGLAILPHGWSGWNRLGDDGHQDEDDGERSRGDADDRGARQAERGYQEKRARERTAAAPAVFAA